MPRPPSPTLFPYTTLFRSHPPLRTRVPRVGQGLSHDRRSTPRADCAFTRSEEHTSELQSRGHLVCRLLLEKKNIKICAANVIKQYTADVEVLTFSSLPPRL